MYSTAIKKNFKMQHSFLYAYVIQKKSIEKLWHILLSDFFSSDFSVDNYSLKCYDSHSTSYNNLSSGNDNVCSWLSFVRVATKLYSAFCFHGRAGGYWGTCKYPVCVCFSNLFCWGILRWVVFFGYSGFFHQ